VGGKAASLGLRQITDSLREFRVLNRFCATRYQSAGGHSSSMTAKLMLTKIKLAAVAVAALAAGTIAFASASEARSWELPIGYASYVVPTRHGHRVCRAFAEYTDWGFYVGNSIHCSRH
jgi:hypothetical protein